MRKLDIEIKEEQLRKAIERNNTKVRKNIDSVRYFARRARGQTDKDREKIANLKMEIIDVRTFSFIKFFRKEIARLRSGSKSDRLYAQQLELEMLYKEKRDKEELKARVIARLGCEPEGEFTLQECGTVLGVTRERVRQLEAQAVRKIKSPHLGRILRESTYEN